MKRADLAAEIASVLEARGKTHGDAVRQHEIQARLLTAYLQGRGLMDDDKKLEAFDAAQFTDLMKTSRIACGDHREVDHYRDKMGYNAIACEAATEPRPGGILELTSEQLRAMLKRQVDMTDARANAGFNGA